MMTVRKRGKVKASDAVLDSKETPAAPVVNPSGQISNQSAVTETTTDASVDMPSESDTFSHAQVDFPVVGLGASAGGLAAFEAFFSGMPADADPGMAFVLVQHLAPDHKSILTDRIRGTREVQGQGTILISSRYCS